MRGRWVVRSKTSTQAVSLYERDHAADRIAAAAEAARGLAFPFTLTARAENHIRGNPDLSDTIARLQRLRGGRSADVVFAPGLGTVEEIPPCAKPSRSRSTSWRYRGSRSREIAEAGAQRISVGGGLTRIAIDAMAAAATTILDSGDLSVLAGRSSVRSVAGVRVSRHA